MLYNMLFAPLFCYVTKVVRSYEIQNHFQADFKPRYSIVI